MSKDFIMTKMMITRKDLLDEVQVEGYVEYHTEFDYGADADGNRGTRKTFVDDVHDVMATDSDEDDFSLTDEERSEAEELLTLKFMES